MARVIGIIGHPFSIGRKDPGLFVEGGAEEREGLAVAGEPTSGSGFDRRRQSSCPGTFERGALDVLHHQIVGPHVVQSADMRMVQRGHSTGFTFKSRGEIFMRDLDGDIVAQARITGFVHFAQGRQTIVARSGRTANDVTQAYVQTHTL